MINNHFLPCICSGDTHPCNFEDYRKMIFNSWDTSLFISKYTEIKGYTCIDILRIHTLDQLCRSVANVKGNMAEVGVYRGGTLKFISEIAEEQEKGVYGFDTFEGIPKVDEKIDILNVGDFMDTSIETVNKYLKYRKNITLIKGVFPDSIPSSFDTNFSFVHVDCDVYQSVFDCCKYFYPLLNSGGIILFDDYGFLSRCPGVKFAVDNFFSSTKEKIIYLITGQAMVMKFTN